MEIQASKTYTNSLQTTIYFYAVYFLTRVQHLKSCSSVDARKKKQKKKQESILGLK